MAATLVAGAVYVAAYQSVYQWILNRPVPSPDEFIDVMRGVPANWMEADDGRELLWADGPRDVVEGEWFDVTGSPLDPARYQYGIGKDSIPAIDKPVFVPIDDRGTLREYGIGDGTIVIGYVHAGESKAYPIELLNRHELVNDMVGGKPVTVGW